MNAPSTNIDRLLHLTNAVCTKAASDDELTELDAILRSDKTSHAPYFEFCRLHVALKLEQQTHDAVKKTFAQIEFRPPVAAPLPISVRRSPFHSSLSTYLCSGWPIAYLIATVIVGIGLIVGALVHVSQPVDVDVVRKPVHRPTNLVSPDNVVARITGMVDCVWDKEGLGIRDWGLDKRSRGEGGRESDSPLSTLQSPLLRLGDRLALRSGLLEISYDTGASVILQGPVRYAVESPTGGYLSIGKLTAKLKKKSEGRSQRSESANQKSEIRNQKSPDLCPLTSDLFAIRTPTATITDLGTEFAVEVGKKGTTTSHVFRGRVRVQTLNDDGKPEGNGRVLRENESARIDGGEDQRTITLVPGPKPAEFFRQMPKPQAKTIDLVDIVAGGDGFSGKRERGIDPTSGRVVDSLRLSTDPNAQEPLSGDGSYHRVPKNPFVDGVFIPDGTKEMVQVNSAGHMFDGFKGTVNQTWQPIWAGGWMQGQEYPTKVWGVEYHSAGHGLILLHASNAITFDLQAIRRANPSRKLLRFRAEAGNGNSALTEDDRKKADIWVLIDGRTCYLCRKITVSGSAFPVSVPIAPSDRFLTLAATDGGDEISHDWIVFGDPRLELSSVPKN